MRTFPVKTIKKRHAKPQTQMSAADAVRRSCIYLLNWRMPNVSKQAKSQYATHRIRSAKNDAPPSDSFRYTKDQQTEERIVTTKPTSAICTLNRFFDVTGRIPSKR